MVIGVQVDIEDGDIHIGVDTLVEEEEDGHLIHFSGYGDGLDDRQ
jgi:hypothetical protein